MAQMTGHAAKGRHVNIDLSKMDNSVTWTNLTSTEKRLRNVHYEFRDKELEEVKKKVLELDIKDDEEEEDEDFYIYDISDIESDFDEELNFSDDDN